MCGCHFFDQLDIGGLGFAVTTQNKKLLSWILRQKIPIKQPLLLVRREYCFHFAYTLLCGLLSLCLDLLFLESEKLINKFFHIFGMLIYAKLGKEIGDIMVQSISRRAFIETASDFLSIFLFLQYICEPPPESWLRSRSTNLINNRRLIDAPSHTESFDLSLEIFLSVKAQHLSCTLYLRQISMTPIHDHITTQRMIHRSKIRAKSLTIPNTRINGYQIRTKLHTSSRKTNLIDESVEFLVWYPWSL